MPYAKQENSESFIFTNIKVDSKPQKTAHKANISAF